MKIWLAVILLLLVGAFSFGLGLSLQTLTFQGLLSLMGLVVSTAVLALYIGYFVGKAVERLKIGDKKHP